MNNNAVADNPVAINNNNNNNNLRQRRAPRRPQDLLLGNMGIRDMQDDIRDILDAEAEGVFDENGNNEDDGNDNMTLEEYEQLALKGKIGKKKLEKIRRKDEKRRYNEYLQAQREDTKRREELREQDAAKQKAEAMEIAKKEAELERLKKEEEERRAIEEYNKWKENMDVEGGGDEQDLLEEEKLKLENLVRRIKKDKIVLLAELVPEFGAKVQQVTSTIESLQLDQRITGIFDDRGKFIYVSETELRELAQRIKSAGRIGKHEVWKIANELFDRVDETIIEEEGEEKKAIVEWDNIEVEKES